VLGKLRGGPGGSAHRFAEFLPDAEGMVERRHSPVAGLLILTVAAIFGSLLGWAALAGIEQVVRADGEVEPAGRVKIVNHPDGGRVAEVHVVEGQRVEPGEPLVTFDPELIRPQLAELTGRLEVKSAEVARLSAEADGGELLVDPELAAARPALIDEQRALLETRRQAYASRIEGVAQEVAQRRNELASIAAELARLRESHALLGEQLAAVRGLAEKGLYPRLRLATLEGQLNDLAGNLHKTQAQYQAAKAALAEAESRRDGVAREWRSSVLADLAAARAERDRLAEAQKRQAATLRNLVVRAPVAGIVQDLGVTSPGQSVGSNQPLMKLVPTGGGLVIEARVANRDIGQIRLGQPAKIKVQAYDFLRYGTLAGSVERIAADATVDPKTGALAYGITVHTDDAELGQGENRFSVVPGMAVEVDLLVGQRTVLSYLTDRIFRLKATAFREG
jgi:adhesin transport system membrane fusion protein